MTNERLSKKDIALTGREVEQMRDVSGFGNQKQLTSPKFGVLTWACPCGRKINAYEDTLKRALRLGEKNVKNKEKVFIEGVLYNTNARAQVGDVVFLIDNTNSHNYPLATLIIFGADQKDSKGLYIQAGNLRTGNNLPVDRLYRPTKVHKDLVSETPLIKRLLEVQGAEIFGKSEKETVPRKSSRSPKTKTL